VKKFKIWSVSEQGLDEFASVLSNAANQEVSADGPKKCDAPVPSQAHEAQ
jgi:hypothetical protein